MFKWPPEVLERLEKFDLLASLGAALAQFGEQLRLQGLEATSKGAPLVYGPDGEPIIINTRTIE